MSSTSGFFALIDGNQAAKRSCDAASVKSMRNKLNTFSDLRKGMKVSIREFESSQKWADRLNAGLMATRWIKASCDAFISMSATALGAVGPKGSGETADAINKGYGLVATLAEAGTQTALGQKVDGVKLAKDLKDSAVSIAGDAKGIANIANVYVNIGVDAARKDGDSLHTGVFLDQTSAVSDIVGKEAKRLAEEAERAGSGSSSATELKGLGKVAGTLKLVADIAKDATKFEQALTAAGDAYIEEKMDIQRRKDSGMRTLMAGLRSLDAKIDKVYAELDSCFVPDTAEPANMTPAK